MKRFKLRVAVAAARSISDQAEVYESASLKARWERSVSDAIQSLRYSPERGLLCGYIDPTLSRLRRIPVSGLPFHLIFYEVLKDADTVRIVDVVDGRRDLKRVLGT